ncbi:MAG TPA: prenyltransferase [Candidatus Dormibacteraeota bacterium]
MFLIWGPLMIGGTYFAATGHVSWQALLASIPYGLLVTSVLMGKHIDKLPWDGPRGVGTLPYLLGEARARRVTEVLMLAFYPVVVVLVVVGALPIPALLIFLAVPRLLEVLSYYRKPRPEAPPPNYPVWPLWYVAAAFLHTRRAGGLMVLGLLIGAILPVLTLHLLG